MNRKCRKCNGLIPNIIVVGGMKKDIRSRKFCLECSPWRKHNKRHLEKRKIIDGVEYKKCPRCKEFKITNLNFYGYSTGACKTCSIRMVYNRRRTIKLRAIEYKGGKCEDCGGVFPGCAYDFHHRDPNEKDFTIGNHDNASWDKLKPELDKCALICSNCHRIRHATEKSK